MMKSLKIVMVFILPVVAVSILALDARAAQKSRHVYQVSLRIESGGPVRAGAPAHLPGSIRIRSIPELNADSQNRFAWHFRNAASLAERFAAKEGLALTRQTVPDKVEVYDSPKSMAEALWLPESEYGCQVVARVDLYSGVVYLGRKSVTDLYVELGKWFLYPAKYNWGRDRARDMALLQQAERFASFCMDKKNWVEDGGSTKSLW